MTTVCGAAWRATPSYQVWYHRQVCGRKLVSTWSLINVVFTSSLGAIPKSLVTTTMLFDYVHSSNVFVYLTEPSLSMCVCLFIYTYVLSVCSSVYLSFMLFIILPLVLLAVYLSVFFLDVPEINHFFFHTVMGGAPHEAEEISVLMRVAHGHSELPLACSRGLDQSKMNLYISE